MPRTSASGSADVTSLLLREPAEIAAGLIEVAAFATPALAALPQGPNAAGFGLSGEPDC